MTERVERARRFDIGGSPESLMQDLQAKQDKNFARTYPFPTSEDEPSEHDRSLDAIERLSGAGLAGELDDKALWRCIDDLLGEAAKRFGEARGAADALGAQGWISVEERLPEAGRLVLVVWRSDMKLGGSFIDTKAMLSGGAWHPTEPYGLVTHWMPLPPAPKEGEER